MALEHEGEISAHVRTRRADGERARDVRRAVLILAAGIDEKKLARRNAPVAAAADAVMHDGAVRSGAGNGRKRNVLEQSGVAAKTFQRFDRIDLGQSTRRFAVEPGKKTRHRRAVAQLRRPRAFDL